MWVGLPELRAALDKVAADASVVAREIVAEEAALVISKAMNNFEGSRKFVKGSRGGRHVVPDFHVGGPKPNVISGDLRRSIKADPIISLGFGVYGTKVGPRMAYGRRVELGYKGSQGYPFFTPAAHDAEADFATIAFRRWSQMI